MGQQDLHGQFEGQRKIWTENGTLIKTISINIFFLLFHNSLVVLTAVTGFSFPLSNQTGNPKGNLKSPFEGGKGCRSKKV